MAAGLQRGWSLSQDAFTKLLNWLDEGNDSKGERYLEIRRRLVQYFARKNCLSPDELADETLNRVARRLTEESAAATGSPARYCYILAKFVFLEACRKPKPIDISVEVAGNDISRHSSPPETDRDEPIHR